MEWKAKASRREQKRMKAEMKRSGSMQETKPSKEKGKARIKNLKRSEISEDENQVHLNWKKIASVYIERNETMNQARHESEDQPKTCPWKAKR